jgi:hypothetical protein
LAPNIQSQVATARDNIPTVVALGVLAYICETVGHEAVGHGGACLLTGGEITALAPLWMHCSVQTPVMVLLGPVFNFMFGAACGAAVYIWPRAGALSLFLWLSCAFNLLVACGYLAVGGAIGFGDWPYLLAKVSPAWSWRLAATALGLIGYYVVLRGLGPLYVRIAGLAGLEKGPLGTRTVLPGASAAVVACAAAFASGRIDFVGLALSVACTLLVGWSLMRIADFKMTSDARARPILTVTFQPIWIVAATIAAAAFVLLIGRTTP